MTTWNPRTEFTPGPAIRLSMVMAGYLALFLLTGREPMLTVALLAGGLFLATERLGLSWKLMLLHYAIGVTAFVVLYLTIGLPLVFALLCGLLALGVLALTQRAARLRSFGNWIFIPAVYLACELGENVSFAARLAALPELLLVSLLGPVAVGLLLLVGNPRADSAPSAVTEDQAPNLQWKRQALAAFGSVLTVASLAMILRIGHPQWMIWSALSVIAVDLPSSTKKLQDRLVGCVLGCPLGFLLGLWVPHTRVLYALAMQALLLTLVSFRTYRIAFTCRCLLTAFAAVVAGGTVEIAEERVFNVILGGLIGFCAARLAVKGPHASSV